MTDSNRLTDLVARLRFYANPLNREAADAIEELVAALKPFADYEAWDGYKDEEVFIFRARVRDLRAARAAYLGEKND